MQFSDSKPQLQQTKNGNGFLKIFDDSCSMTQEFNDSANVISKDNDCLKIIDEDTICDEPTIVHKG